MRTSEMILVKLKICVKFPAGTAAVFQKKDEDMKREIKFRGKRIDNGEWVIGSLITCEKYTDIWVANPQSGLVSRYEVNPETVGQYTGLKDKDNKEIYEGDILLLSDRQSYKENVVVEHGLYGWTFYNPQTATFYSDGSHTYAAVENYRFMFGTGAIIGNIHDNPKLLNR